MAQSKQGHILKTQTAYQGPVFDVQKLAVTTPDGLKVERDLIKTAPTVTILALANDQQVVMTSEYRVGINAESLSLPAGIVNPGETVETAALRELREETGYVGTSCELMTTITSSEGFMDQTCALVLVHFDQRTREATHFDADEYVNSQLVPFETVKDWVLSGRVNTAQGVSAVLFYDQMQSN